MCILWDLFKVLGMGMVEGFWGGSSLVWEVDTKLPNIIITKDASETTINVRMFEKSYVLFIFSLHFVFV